jgi:hypothetical protein
LLDAVEEEEDEEEDEFDDSALLSELLVAGVVMLDISRPFEMLGC